ncbi:MAG: restriction endonuclease subunit S [Bacteroidetes bacterium]|nr:restriction endonuclease subunit S [Bacteroidota bacterium]
MYNFVKLKTIASISTGFPFKGEKYSNEGIRVVRGENVTEGLLRWDSIKCWNEDFDQIDKYSLKEGDVVIGMDGSKVGKNRARVKSNDLPLLLAQRVALIRKNELSNQNFLYYLIRASRFVEYVERIQTGSSVPHISQKQIEEYPVPLISVDVQKKISEVLSSLDTKIEINKSIKTELDAMAKTLYDYWFVQFDFPDKNGKPYKSSGGKMVWSEKLKREIPEGWEVTKLKEVLTIRNGRDHKNLESGIIPVYGSGGIMRHANKFLYDSESILIPRKGTLSNLFYVNQPFWCVDTIFYTQMRFAQSCKYLFYSIRAFNISSMNTGTAVPSMTTEVLNNLKIAFPPFEILNSFDIILSPIFQMKDKLAKRRSRTYRTSGLAIANVDEWSDQS